MEQHLAVPDARPELKKKPPAERRKARRLVRDVLRLGCSRSPRGYSERNTITVRRPALRSPHFGEGGKREFRRARAVKNRAAFARPLESLRYSAAAAVAVLPPTSRRIASTIAAGDA